MNLNWRKEILKTNKASQSAQQVAILRAAHLYVDGEPKILEDNFALLFIGKEYEELFKTNAEMFQAPQAKVVRSLTLCRSRIAEDLLIESLEQDTRQYVILGSGLDSFAFRRPDLKNKVRIFEVDHPASLQFKIQRLEKNKIKFPDNLSLIPVDFEEQTLSAEFEKSDYNPGIPTFYSWLGVTQFISEESVFETLKFVATSSPGSQIVFQYCLPDETLNAEEFQQRTWARQRAEEIGEPWKSTFYPENLVTKLKEFGFTQIEDIDQSKAERYLQSYFLNRTDDLKLTFGKGGTALMRAVV